MANKSATVTLTLTDEMSDRLRAIGQEVDNISKKMKDVGDTSRAAFKAGGEQADRTSESVKRLHGVHLKFSEELHKNFIKLSQSAGRAVGQVAGLEEAFGAASGGAARFVLGLGGITAGSGLAAGAVATLGVAAVAAAQKISEAYKQARNFRTELGEVDTRRIDAWRDAAERAGIATEKMNEIMEKGTAGIRSMSRGEFSPLFQMFREHGEVGVAMYRRLDDLRKQGVPALEVFHEELKMVMRTSETFQREWAESRGVPFGALKEFNHELERSIQIRSRPEMIEASRRLTAAQEKLNEATEEYDLAWAKFEPTWVKIESMVVSGLAHIMDGVNAVSKGIEDWHLPKVQPPLPLKEELLGQPSTTNPFNRTPGPPTPPTSWRDLIFGPPSATNPFNRAPRSPNDAVRDRFVFPGEGAHEGGGAHEAPLEVVPRLQRQSYGGGDAPILLHSIASKETEGNAYLRDIRDMLALQRGGATPYGGGGDGRLWNASLGSAGTGFGAGAGFGGGLGGAGGAGDAYHPLGGTGGSNPLTAPPASAPPRGTANLPQSPFGQPFAGMSAAAASSGWSGSVMPGAGGGSYLGQNVSRGTAAYLMQQRASLMGELNDPRKRESFFGLMQAEGGNLSPRGQQAMMETAVNRWASRGQSVMEGIASSYYGNNPRYRPPTAANRAAFGDLLAQVGAGSDISGGATGNASGTVGVGRQTMSDRGERFGIETFDANRAFRRGYEGLRGGGGWPNSAIHAASAHGGAMTAEQAGISPAFPVADNVNWKNLNAEYLARVNAAYGDMPAGEKAKFKMISGYRPATREEARRLGMSEHSSQESIWERSGHGRLFAAAPPGRSRHQGGEAGDYSTTDWLRAHQREYGLQDIGARLDYPHIQMRRGGRSFLDPSVIDRAIAKESNVKPAALGSAQVDVNFNNVPKGTRTKASGDGVFENVRIKQTPQMNTTGAYGSAEANSYSEE